MSNKKELQRKSTTDVDSLYIIHNSYGEAWSVETGCWVNFEQATQMSCGEASAMLMLWGFQLFGNYYPNVDRSSGTSI